MGNHTIYPSFSYFPKSSSVVSLQITLFYVHMLYWFGLFSEISEKLSFLFWNIARVSYFYT